MKRPTTGDALVQDDAQRPDIDTRTDEPRRAADQLRSHVYGLAHDIPICALDTASEPYIADLRLTGLIEEDISGLQFAMHKLLGMAGSESTSDSRDQARRGPPGHPTDILKPLDEGATRNEFERENRLSFVLGVVVDLHHIRVTNRGNGVRVCVKPSECLRIVAANEFQRNGAAKPLLFRFVDTPNSPAAEFPDELVTRYRWQWSRWCRGRLANSDVGGMSSIGRH